MLTTAQEVYTRVKTRIGKLARRMDTPLMTPSEKDEDALEIYLRDGLVKIGTKTDRLTTIIELTTTIGQEWVIQPPHLDRIEEASLIRGSEAWTVELEAGQDVAQWARDPNADTGPPEYVGAYNDRLYLFPVPDDEYPLDLHATLNGQVSDNGSSPAVPEDPPELDTIVERVPGDFDQALVAFVVGRWMLETAQSEVQTQLADNQLGIFRREIREHNKEPSTPVTASRDYNIL